jgi:uncharacterized lipoprotein YbaY
MPRVGKKDSTTKSTSEELVPFGLRFRDKALRKQIKTEALQRDIEMSEYIVMILRQRKHILPLLEKST